jgi:hypothetical protein
MVRQVGKPFTATLTVTPTVVRQTAKRLTAPVTATATLAAQRVFLRALTATVTATATITRRTGKAVTATVTAAATIQKRIAKTLAAFPTVIAALVAEITGGQPIGHIDSDTTVTHVDDGGTGVFATVDSAALVALLIDSLDTPPVELLTGDTAVTANTQLGNGTGVVESEAMLTGVID